MRYWLFISIVAHALLFGFNDAFQAFSIPLPKPEEVLVQLQSFTSVAKKSALLQEQAVFQKQITVFDSVIEKVSEPKLIESGLEEDLQFAVLDDWSEVLFAKQNISMQNTPEFDLYLANWHKKVEWIGRLNYPAEAMQQKIYGELELVVKIRADGSLQSVELSQSSGHPILDTAAIRIVELAAPYAPLPVSMRQQGNLELRRTWRFLKDKVVL